LCNALIYAKNIQTTIDEEFFLEVTPSSILQPDHNKSKEIAKKPSF
jgi:hypothetical protein